MDNTVLPQNKSKNNEVKGLNGLGDEVTITANDLYSSTSSSDLVLEA
jgi:hypothetical protein